MLGKNKIIEEFIEVVEGLLEELDQAEQQDIEFAVSREVAEQLREELELILDE